jgi:hypothetical protein
MVDFPAGVVADGSLPLSCGDRLRSSREDQLLRRSFARRIVFGHQRRPSPGKTNYSGVIRITPAFASALSRGGALAHPSRKEPTHSTSTVRGRRGRCRGRHQAAPTITSSSPGSYATQPRTRPVSAQTEIGTHFEVDLELVPLSSEGPDRQVELRGAPEHAGFLVIEEAGSPTNGRRGWICRMLHGARVALG